MPYADPEKSFDVAVRHLFRHLYDSAALQRNPLVKQLIASEIARVSDNCAVAIRARILYLAAACKSDEIKAGRGAQALRRYAIIAGICAGDLPESTAGELGLSVRQYYRDRQAICARIARLLAARKSSILAAAESHELLQLLLRRAASLVDNGLPLKAVALLENALGEVESEHAKIAVFLSRSRALIQYGDVVLATESLEAAKRLLRDLRNPPLGPTSLSDEADLTAVDVAIASGRESEARTTLDILVKRLRLGRANNHLANELALDILLESTSHHFVGGRFTQAREALCEATTLANMMDEVRSDLRVFLAVMKASICEDGFHTPGEGILLNEEALNISLSTGSARGALYAMCGLMRSYLQMGDEDQAFAWFQKGVHVARTMEGTKPILSAAIAGTTLISTRYWHELGPLLREVQGVVTPGSLKWAQLHGAQGMYLARTGRPKDALRRLRAASDLAESLHNTRYHADLLREQGIVFHRLGCASDSIECIRAAVVLAEKGTSSLSLYQTHSAAATILGDDPTSWPVRRARYSMGLRKAGTEIRPVVR